jgi:TP901 family phage tail tape measure protein
MAEGFKAGSIVAMLALDKTGWNASVKSVGTDTAKMKGSFGGVMGSMSAMGKTMTIAGGAVVASIAGIVTKMALMGEALWEMHQKTGIDVETLSAWKLSADKAGVGLEGLGIGFKKLSSVLVDAAAGSDEAKATLDTLGISATDNSGKIRSMDDVMLDVADRFSRMEDGAMKASIAQDLFGKSGMQLILMLNEGKDALAANVEKAKELGIVFSTEAARASDEFCDSLDEMKGSLGGAAKEIGLALMPAVSDMVKKITDTVIKIKDWIKAHPELVKQIGGVGLKVGALVTVLGTVLMIVPKILMGFKNMGSMLLSSTGMWTAAAATVGYYILKLVELKEAKQAAAEADKRFKDNQEFVRQKLFEVAQAAGLNADQFDALTKKYGENLSELRKHIKAGDEGVAMQGALAGAAKKHADAADEQKKKVAALKKETGEFIPIIEDATKKQKTWGEIMEEYGILPLKDKKDKIGELLGQEEKLNQMLKDGTIDSAEYGKGIVAINDKLKELGTTTMTQVLPPAKDLSDIWKQAPSTVSDLAYSVGDLDDQMKAYGDSQGYSTNTVKAFIYELQRMRLAMIGIVLPEIDFTPWTKGAEDTARDMYQPFDTLWSNVAGSFGDAVKGMLFEGDTLKEGWKGICDSMKEAVASMIGEMVTKWVKGLLTDMVGTATKAAASTATTFSTMGAAVGGIAGAIGTVITTLATAIATAIGTIAVGIGTALVTVATAVATAATILAAAIVPLLTIGALAVALYVAFGLAKGLLDKLFGGGGGKSSDVTYWLKLMWEVGTNTMNWFKSAGSGFGGASYEFITAHMGDWLTAIKTSIDETRTGICAYINTSNDILRDIRERLNKLKSAAGGAAITGTELVAVHGSAAAPEYIIPSPDLKSILAAAPQKRAGANVTIRNEININGTMVTDREYVRGRLLKEIGNALRSGIGRAEIQSALGV